MTAPPSRPVIWTAEARSNLIAIRTYIGQFSPLAAQRFTARLIAAAESLDELPSRGRPVWGLHELTVIRPYVIRYRVTPDAVYVLRIRHAARRPGP